MFRACGLGSLGCLRCLGVLGLMVQVFRVFRVFREFSVGFWGLVVGFNFGFGGTKTTRNVTWGSILTPCRKKCSKQLKK